ncbi:MAG: DUF998 domain-containing protein [Candidatus Thorarchaeota archaeon]|nr:DUF998 domain-containing protein [Candidatus Thorarchaeota archaeon]
MVETTKRLRKLSFICGILSSLLYFCADILGGMIWGNYDFTTQYISELSAIDASSRSFVVSLYILYNIIVIPFALGVLRFAGRKRVLRITGGMLIGYIATGLAGLFFPMDPSGTATTFTNIMHQIFAGVIVFFILLSLGFGAAAFATWFRYYSIGIILVYLVLGALPFLSVVQFEAGQPIPWVGLVERMMVYGYVLWVSVLSLVLMRMVRDETQLTAAISN